MSLIKQIKGSFSEERTFTFNDLDPFGEQARWISSGIPCIDYGLKTFGFPIGVVEVRGESQSGKTTLTLHAMKECIRQYKDNAVVTILSSEKRDNKLYAKKIGIDLDEVLIHRVTTIEDTFNKIKQTIDAAEKAIAERIKVELKDKKVPLSEFEKEFQKAKKETDRVRYLFIWDSLGNTVSGQEVSAMNERAEKDTEKAPAMASAARAISMGLRGTLALTDTYDITLLVINRGYDKLDTPGKESYGGKAIKFIPTMRIELARKAPIKQGEVEIGQVTQVNIIKSDYGGIKEKFDVEMIYGFGFVLSADDVSFGLNGGYLEKYGVLGCKYNSGGISWMTRKNLLELYNQRSPKLELLRLRLLKSAHDQVIKDRAEFLAFDEDEDGEEEERKQRVAKAKEKIQNAKNSKLSKYKTKK